MPRININEKDRTSPGTPSGYSNNTVLIAGFSTRTNEEIIKAVEENPNIGYILPDDNGVFEFTSADDFKDTIGLVAPGIVQTEATIVTSKLPVHYGNQMAYELLNMGYPIIYLSLGAPGKTVIEGTTSPATAVELMNKLADEDTWAIFKDKASYDFRFVSHGLLTSEEYAKSDDLVKLEKLVAKMREFLPVYDNEAFYDNEGNVVTEQPVDATTEHIAEVAKLYEDAVASELAYFNSTKKSDRDAIGYTEKFIKNNATWYVAEALIETKEKDIKDAATKESNENFGDDRFIVANTEIAKLAAYVAQPAPMEDEMAAHSGRGDCIALIEVDESKYISGAGRPENRIITAINAMSITGENGKYCACTVPSVIYNMTPPEEFGGNKKFPGAFHYLACFKNSLDLGFAEWYAAAGYNRGVSSYSIDHTSVKLGEIAIQALEPRYLVDDPQKLQPKFAVNVIANFRGSYYLWGNRTCEQLKSYAGGGDLVASHFLNIRQLCTTIKKQLYVSCRRFTFDPNSDILWINFKNSITPMLDRMKADQGVRDYKIEKVYTDKKATLKARIRIVPIEAVEDFILEVSLEDSLGETAVTVVE